MKRGKKQYSIKHTKDTVKSKNNFYNGNYYSHLIKYKYNMNKKEQNKI